MKISLVIVAALLCVNIIISCSGDGSKTQGSFETRMKPSDVVVAAYMNTSKNKYSEFKKYLSAEALTAIKETTELASGIKDVWDKKTRNGIIDGIEIIQEDVQGEKATIALRLYFNDGYISDEHECLIKEDGQWKMTL
jgi:hypothetical protein